MLHRLNPSQRYDIVLGSALLITQSSTQTLAGAHDSQCSEGTQSEVGVGWLGGGAVGWLGDEARYRDGSSGAAGWLGDGAVMWRQDG